MKKLVVLALAVMLMGSLSMAATKGTSKEASGKTKVCCAKKHHKGCKKCSLKDIKSTNTAPAK
jgi:hypothetical protein